MKKRLIFSAFGAVAGGVSALTYVLKDDEKRQALKEKVRSYTPLYKQKQDAQSSSIEKAGKPDLDQPENADMVAEGSQFGVQYFNKVKEDEDNKAT